MDDYLTMILSALFSFMGTHPNHDYKQVQTSFESLRVIEEQDRQAQKEPVQQPLPPPANAIQQSPPPPAIAVLQLQPQKQTASVDDAPHSVESAVPETTPAPPAITMNSKLIATSSSTVIADDEVAPQPVAGPSCQTGRQAAAARTQDFVSYVGANKSDVTLPYSVDDATQAKHTVNLLADAFKAGVKPSYFYALAQGAPDQSMTDAVAKADDTPETVSAAIQNLTSILSDKADDSTTFPTGTLNYSLSNTVRRELQAASEGRRHILSDALDGRSGGSIHKRRLQRAKHARSECKREGRTAGLPGRQTPLPGPDSHPTERSEGLSEESTRSFSYTLATVSPLRSRITAGTRTTSPGIGRWLGPTGTILSSFWKPRTSLMRLLDHRAESNRNHQGYPGRRVYQPDRVQPNGGYDFTHIPIVVSALGTTGLFLTPHIYYDGTAAGGAAGWTQHAIAKAKANGLIAVIDEFGDAMDGFTRNPQGHAVIKAVIDANEAGQAGAVFWAMDNGNHPDGGDLAFLKPDGSVLTPIGKMLQPWLSKLTTPHLPTLAFSGSSQNVVLNMGDTFGSVKVFDPVSGSSPVQSLDNVNSVTLSMTDHPLVVEVAAPACGAGGE